MKTRKILSSILACTLLMSFVSCSEERETKKRTRDRNNSSIEESDEETEDPSIIRYTDINPDDFRAAIEDVLNLTPDSYTDFVNSNNVLIIEYEQEGEGGWQLDYIEVLEGGDSTRPTDNFSYIYEVFTNPEDNGVTIDGDIIYQNTDEDGNGYIIIDAYSEGDFDNPTHMYGGIFLVNGKYISLITYSDNQSNKDKIDELAGRLGFSHPNF